MLFYVIITDDTKTGGRNLQAITQLQTANSYDEAVETGMKMFRDHPEANTHGFGEAWYKNIQKELRKTGWVVLASSPELRLTLSILKLGK